VGTAATPAPAVLDRDPCGGRRPASASAPNIMVVVLENREYPDVIGSASAPYLTSLATRYGVATHAYAIQHPSQPNYVEMVSGDTQGIVDDSAGPSFEAPSLAGQLHDKGIGWRAYIGGVSQPCYTGAGTDTYTRSHNPLIRFKDVRDDPAQCASVVPTRPARLRPVEWQRAGLRVGDPRPLPGRPQLSDPRRLTPL